MINDAYLDLSLRTVLALHDPRRRPGSVTLTQLFRALRRMHQQLQANEAAAKAEQLNWLADEIDKACASRPE